MSAKNLVNEALVEIVDDLTGIAAEQEMMLDLMTDALIEATGEIMKRELALSIAAEVIIPALAAEIDAYQKKERDAAELAQRLERTLNIPSLTDWAVKRFIIVFKIDGVSVTAEIEVGSRHILTNTYFNSDGDPEKTVAISSAVADVTVNLPFIGAVTIRGNVKHTETSYPHSQRISVTNELSFTLPIGEVEREVKVTSEGVIWKKDGDGWDYGVSAMINHQECGFCHGDHGNDEYYEVIVS